MKLIIALLGSASALQLTPATARSVLPDDALANMYKTRWQGEALTRTPSKNALIVKDENKEVAYGCVTDNSKPVCGELSFDSTDGGMVSLRPMHSTASLIL